MRTILFFFGGLVVGYALNYLVQFMRQAIAQRRHFRESAGPLPPLVNAASLERENADSFQRPSPAEIAGLMPGDAVKVAFPGERFWVRITQRSPEGQFAGELCEDLVCYPLAAGTRLEFGADNIYSLE